MARADRETYSVVQEKNASNSWDPPASYTIDPDPASRFHDTSSGVDPLLPPPAPKLYAYELPELIQPSGARPGAKEKADAGEKRAESSPTADESLSSETDPAIPHPAHGLSVGKEIGTDAAPRINPVVIPDEAWNRLPTSCKTRMFNFERLRLEYRRTYGIDPPAHELASARLLSLADVVALAQINNREYQTQKEFLYRQALRLTLERYRFQLKPVQFGNFVGIDYLHARGDDGSVNTLAIPQGVGFDTALATGGDFVARFANNVVLTLDGPNGFAADVSNELFFEFFQSIFQRDVRFEALTQAERNVVYAARELARFRKVLFQRLATRYYSLLQTYREIEIGALDYMTLVRSLVERREELRVGKSARIQADQIEQNALTSLARLAETCNRLERDIDNLKIEIGLPTELPIDLELSELEEITRRDEAAVAFELVRRARRLVESSRNDREVNIANLFHDAVDLIERLEESISRSGRFSAEKPKPAALGARRLKFEIDERESERQRLEATLAAESRDPSAPPLRLVHQAIPLIDVQLNLLSKLADLLAYRASPHDELERLKNSQSAFTKRAGNLEAKLQAVLDQLRMEQIPALLSDARQLRADIDAELRRARASAALGAEAPPRDKIIEDARLEIDRLLNETDEYLKAAGAMDLPQVDVPVDDAMMTALLLRLDLMNERGLLADAWRQIKLAADDLKSILDFRATHELRDFSFAQSQTRLSATLDTPLIRKSQRNDFREALIDYQFQRRRLMEQEDTIKLAIRNDLRALNLAGQQYSVSVAGAALAFERVAGTSLQLRLGVVGVQARDFLEAQTDYTAALSDTANRHLSHIVARAQLFLDAEWMQLDESGFWRELYVDDFELVPVSGLFDLDNAYGELPAGLHFSRKMRRMTETPIQASPRASQSTNP